MIDFNPQNKTILINTNEQISIEYVYSRWKDWVLKDRNAKYLPAFKVKNDGDRQFYELINNWSIINIEKLSSRSDVQLSL